ncbi:response regulator [Corynebacterium poyangense]|uniref:Response regulator n=1 Tax=Corynebacterium poyangense TaxID=2684405 RepID=A0A7H0SMB3_9CORY|nr:response regulator transcription factor [Corynebacterium poyangense]MBZ8176788.1 response regulator [Corynebacterium poyangense]QNQ89688.1 response regulator [Corynebacterium poyangense]
MVSVFLVDDHSVFRAGVRTELMGSGVTVLGEAGTVTEAISGIERTHPDVVLLDVHMPDGGGLAVIRGTTIDTRFLALSVSDAAEDVIALIRAGARGYVRKSISGADLAAAITQVASGDAYFSPRLAGFVLDAFAGGQPAKEAQHAEDDPIVDALTRREKEVLRLLARGYTYREIAQRLFISIKTVETHASNILRKTQQSNRYALTRWAQSRALD